MTSDLVLELMQATLAGSAAIAAVLLLRRPLRTRFGARMAYRAWAAVPLAMLAVVLPAAQAPVSASTTPTAMPWTAGAIVQASAPSASALAWVWIAGVVLCAAWFALRQRRFVRRLERTAGRRLARVDGQGPAVVGAWRALIVLPEDFRERYTRGERRLVLAHEVAHLRRGDLHAQAFATALRCLFWFNPLVHLAAAWFRFDQELACDATVLARFPRGRARYGSAMLKTQLAGFGLPVGCHWQSSHPLKERIEMLKQPLPARARTLSGALLVVALTSAGTYAAWAAQPATPAGAPAEASQARPLTSITEADDLTAPKYPATAPKVDGMVVLELLVGVDGKVKDVKVVSSTPAGLFDQASIDAARQWTMTPATQDGVPVEGWVRVPIAFHGDGKPKDAAATSN